jgi:hypothetical protein
VRARTLVLKHFAPVRSFSDLAAITGPLQKLRAHTPGVEKLTAAVVISRFRLERSGFIKGKIHGGRDDTCRRRILRKFVCSVAGMFNSGGYFCANISLTKRSKKKTTSTSIWHEKDDVLMAERLGCLFFTLCISRIIKY